MHGIENSGQVGLQIFKSKNQTFSRFSAHPYNAETTKLPIPQQLCENASRCKRLTFLFTLYARCKLSIKTIYKNYVVNPWCTIFLSCGPHNIALKSLRAGPMENAIVIRKLRLFGHICRMDDSRKIKTPVFEMTDGSNKRGRPHREWSDDIEQWCGATLHELSHAALDRQRWAAIVTMASDTNGHWPHGCRWWWWWTFSPLENFLRAFMTTKDVVI